jgi:hypothetical protein
LLGEEVAPPFSTNEAVLERVQEEKGLEFVVDYVFAV